MLNSKKLEPFYLNQIERQVDDLFKRGVQGLSYEQLATRRDMLKKWQDQIARHLRSEFSVVFGGKHPDVIATENSIDE